MASIKYKFPFILLLVISLFGLAGAWLSNAVIMPPFEEMDRERVSKDLRRSINAFLYHIDSLEVTARDWSQSQETYQFMAQRNPGFIEERLSHADFVANNIDVILYIDSQDQLVWSGYVANREIASVVPIEYRDQVARFADYEINLEQLQRKMGMFSGIYAQPEFTFLFSMAPIRDSQGQRPEQGRLFIGRFLTADMLAELQRRTRVAFTISPLLGQPLTEQQQAFTQQLARSRQSSMVEKDDRLVASSVIVTANGQYVLITVAEEKSLAALGRKLINEMILWLVVGGLLIFILSFFLIRKFVVKPILKVAEHVREVHETDDLYMQLDSKSNDEIGLLSRYIDEFIARLADSLTELQRSNSVQRSELNYRRDLEFHLQQSNEQVKHMAPIDNVTGVANRRVFDEVLIAEWSRMRRHQRYLALMLVDIDGFDSFNRDYGRAQGDECLNKVATALVENFRRSEDLVARFGGDKFAVILPECYPEAAKKAGEEAIKTINSQYIVNRSVEKGLLTCSVGVCCVRPGATFNAEEFVGIVETNLAAAREAGGNQVYFSVMENEETATILLAQNEQSMEKPH